MDVCKDSIELIHAKLEKMWNSKKIQTTTKIKYGLVCFRDRSEKVSDDKTLTWKTVPLSSDY